MTHERLKARQRVERQGYPPNLGLRVHRALSWLGRAEQLADDVDAQFIFLWIAFNAAYATEIDEKYRLSEQATFRAFLQKLVELDSTRGRIGDLVWREFTGSIRVLLGNPFVFAEFWQSHNGVLAPQEWKSRFAEANRAAQAALARQDTVSVRGIVLSRNQLMHGGATWNSAVNRDQLRDCAHFMGKLVPLVIEIMMDHPGALWGDACYPVVGA